MNLSNINNIRFNGIDVKLMKLNGSVIYSKEDQDVIIRYTTNESGITPKFNSDYAGYEVVENGNDDGTYTVSVRTDNVDNLPTSITFNSSANILTIDKMNTSKVTSLMATFQGFANLISIDLSESNTSNVTAMMSMCNNCQKLTYVNVSGLNTSKVTNMSYMFQNCPSLTSMDMSGFDMLRVTTMAQMFYGCSSITSIDLSGIDAPNVTDMSRLFYNCKNLASIDTAGFKASTITNMSRMFYDCNNIISLDLSGINASNVTDMTNIFYGCNKLTSLNPMTNIKVSLTLPSSLNQESVLAVVNNLENVSDMQTLTVSTTQLSWIPSDKITEANNKGWTISA